MAIAKWMPFAAAQPTSETTKSEPVAPIGVTTADAKKFGLENFGNTCYANSVLQALYFCTPFRELILQSTSLAVQDNVPSIAQPPPSAAVPGRRKPERKYSGAGQSIDASHTNGTQPNTTPIPSSPATLFSALRSLFLYISKNPADTGTVAPRAFIDKLKDVNELFRSNLHQDAHEFLNYLLNKIVEEIEEERKRQQDGTFAADDLSSSVATLSTRAPPTTGSNSGTSPQDATLVHKLFEGVLTSETRCLTCETVSSRDESFLDLSIDIEQNSSVTACLKQFSASEMLCQRNKFFCDACCDLQEAEKRMKIKKLPNILALHLKRFKYQEDVQKYIKLAYRVAFPFELRLFNTVDDTDDADRLYELFSIVVHIGNGPHHGHYISLIKTLGSWLIFDDDAVGSVKESDIPKYFGDSNSGSAYVLYYQAVDIDLEDLGIRPQIPETAEPRPHAAETSPQPQPQPPPPPAPAPVHPPGLDSDLPDISYPAIVPPPPLSQPLITEISSPLKLVADPEPLPPAPPNLTTATAVNNARESFLRTIRRGPSGKARTGEHRGSAEGPPRPPTSAGPPPVTNSDFGPSSPSTQEGAKDKRKEAEKSSTWFKRKSQKMRSENIPEPSSSTMSPPKTEDDFTWFRASGHPPKHKSDQRPSESNHHSDTSFLQSRFRSAAAPPLKPPDNRANGYESSPGSASSSTSTSFAHTPLELPRQSPSSPTSTSLPAIGHRAPPPPHSPKQQKSTSQLNGLRPRDHESPVSSTRFPPRPSTAGAMSRNSDNPRPLPPVPPLPPLPSSPFPGSLEHRVSNGHASGRNAPTARSRNRPIGGVDEVPDLRPHTAHGHAGLGLGSFADSNQSNSTSSSTSSNAKKPKRKLSLTAPILGFGRRDKDKQKEKEKSPHHTTTYPMGNRL